MNSVDIEALRSVTNRIFDFIEKDLGVATVDLPHEYYWSVADDGAHSMDQPPKVLGVGSLSDDLSFVMAAHKDPRQAIPLVLMHIAPVLKALSTAVPSFTSPPPN